MWGHMEETELMKVEVRFHQTLWISSKAEICETSLPNCEKWTSVVISHPVCDIFVIAAWMG